MKLASIDDGTRDGQLVVVSRDLRVAARAPAPDLTLLGAMDDWEASAPRLRHIYDVLSGPSGRSGTGVLDFGSLRLTAPLPCAPQWLDASAFHSHGDLMERVFGAAPREDKLRVPLMYQGASDDFLGPCDDMPLPSEDDGIDFEAELAVMVDHVPMGTPAATALSHVKLLLLVNDASLRAFAGRELQTGFGFIQAKPASSFAPVAVTPDELGVAWRNGRVELPVNVHWNQRWFGHPHGGAMGFGFHELIAHAARTRNLRAGTIIGSGTVSNVDYRSVGSGCIAEKRAIEIADSGKPTTPYMKFGDTVRIEVLADDGSSVFGAIDQRVVQAPVHTAVSQPPRMMESVPNVRIR
jgi:fumarylacetoacetate (FAA) hydrolase